MIYGLALSLPMELQRSLDLTFSTYEANPLECEARVVATCYANDDPGLKIPTIATHEADIVIDCTIKNNSAAVSYQTSKFQKYAEFVTQCLIKNNEQFLRSFIKMAEDNRIGDLTTLLDFAPIFQAIQNNTITVTDVETILGRNTLTLAFACLEHTHVLQVILEKALLDKNWWKNISLRLIEIELAEKNYSKPDFINNVKAKLAQEAGKMVSADLSRSPQNTTDTTVLMDIIIQVASASQQPALFQKLLEDHAAYYKQMRTLPYQMYVWEQHKKLLWHWSQLGSLKNFPAIASWLKLPEDVQFDYWPFMKNICSMDILPDEWKKVTIDNVLPRLDFDLDAMRSLIDLNRGLRKPFPYKWLNQRTQQLLEETAISVHTFKYIYCNWGKIGNEQWPQEIWLPAAIKSMQDDETFDIHSLIDFLQLNNQSPKKIDYSMFDQNVLSLFQHIDKERLKQLVIDDIPHQWLKEIIKNYICEHNYWESIVTLRKDIHIKNEFLRNFIEESHS